MPTQHTDLQQFLEQHPDIEMFEVILPDLNGRQRGKWIARDKIEKAFAGSLKLPISSLAFDIWGRDPEALVFDSGDADGLAVADINTLVPVPWLKRKTGQVLLSMSEVTGEPCAYDGRNVVRALMERFQRLGLTPVVACEMEFSLFRQELDEQGRPCHTQSELGATMGAGSTYGIEAMQDVSDLMHDIYDACEVQGLPVDTLIKEAAPSQYEINLYHQDDALRTADQAFMLQRVIKGVAKRHGYRASFMAKPFGDQAGNGMHVHCSVIDKAGANAFNNGTEEGSELLRHAIAGCLAGMADTMLMFAPHLNSYRRFQRGSHAPLAANWGYENRTVSVRVPADKPQAKRIEHRVAGADANPYLVVAAILAGILRGIEERLDAPAPIEGNGYEQSEPDLPTQWFLAHHRFAHSEFVGRYLGEPFQRTFSAVKLQELDEFSGQISALEYETYL